MNPLNSAASDAISIHQAALCALIVEHQYRRHPELEKRYGRAGRTRCLEDAAYHLRYLAQAISAQDPALFADYIAWAKIMLMKRGVPAKDLGAMLEIMEESLRSELPAEVGALASDYVRTTLAQLPRLADEVPSFLDAGAPLAALAADYLRALRASDRRAAGALVLDAAQRGTPVRDLYMHVFEPTQHEIGRLWQINQLGVAEEHYCTAATQLIMSQLYPYIFVAGDRRGTAVATCVSGDLHELGARMVCDFLELDGWSTHFLGANMPSAEIVRTVIEKRAAVLAISATIAYHVPAVEALIGAIRQAPECRGVKVIVGGHPFNVAADLWRTVGADGAASDARSAATLATELTAARGAT